MPARSKTSDAEIVRAALELLESRGAEGFSMADLAGAVGVRAPSLYGRFADRATLIDAVEVEQWCELGRRLHAAATGRGALAVLTRQARAYRAFAKANPAAYALMFRIDADRSEAGQAARAAAVAASLPAFAALVGSHAALPAARVLTPFLHGFVSMELAGAFRLGGGVDAAFEHGVATILRGLSRAGRPTAPPRRRRPRRPP
ncbi:MAG TPA: TetR/AcrR family transcriptional regulator [Kofleriaceae bacterium]|jgi:AcrR family transcriptional regulator|nr:TetR/AcrR family transcriptional regulator [Kofleriaceae bacterium]